jgi:plastocyanin
MPRIDIVRRAGRVVFEPDPLLVFPGDIVFWRNLDEDDEHWITKSGEPRTFWFPSPLSRFVNGQPPAVTSGVLINGNISYQCALHPGERGEIETS